MKTLATFLCGLVVGVAAFWFIRPTSNRYTVSHIEGLVIRCDHITGKTWALVNAEWFPLRDHIQKQVQRSLDLRPVETTNPPLDFSNQATSESKATP
jgi:hypothetical protein